MNDILRIACLRIALQRAFLGRAILIFTLLKNIDIDINIDMIIFENIDIDINIDKAILKISISILISIW